MCRGGDRCRDGGSNLKASMSPHGCLNSRFASRQAYDLVMKLDATARQLIGSDPATLVTNNRDGSPQVSVVWVTVQGTADGGDELVTAHLQEHQKIRNIRRDPRVAVTIVSTDRSGPQTPYLSIKGTARVEEGGAPELLDEIATTIFGPGTGFPPPGAPPGYLTHITIEKVGGVGPWAS
jgi:PPOX class probable F420-dependent enzyme